MSVILLALSFVPCTDTMTANQNIQITTFHQDGQSHSHHSDFCSPLCSCNCCGTVIAQIEEEVFFEFLPEIDFSAEEPVFRQKIPAAIYFSILEPPKIV